MPLPHCEICDMPAFAFKPGTPARTASGGFIVERGEPSEALCLRHFGYRYGPKQPDLFNTSRNH